LSHARIESGMAPFVYELVPGRVRRDADATAALAKVGTDGRKMSDK
jgi:hypothetical protein